MKKDFTILIVEDELMIAEMTKEMLGELGYRVVGIAKNSNEAHRFLSSESTIDMAILDINLNDKKDGIDIAGEIQDQYGIPFIFLTSYSDPKTIKKAAQTAPDAYLLKPYTRGDLFATIEMIRARKDENNQTIVIKDGTQSIKLESRNIEYIKSDNVYIEIHTKQKKYLIRQSLETFLEELADSNLVRIHRSYAANILSVDAINSQHVIVGDTRCPISRAHKKEVAELYSRIQQG
jgi:two-component system response regulator LytT